MAGASAAGVTLISPLDAFYARVARGLSLTTIGYGPLAPKLPDNTNNLPANLQGIPLLELPDGFRYVAFSIFGQTLSDGNPVPSAHDGMAAFPGPSGRIVLIRNHEVSVNVGGVVAPDSQKYDPDSAGGTTTLVLSPQGTLIRDFVSLAGTRRNCAGGPTPWGSWLSCEEDTTITRNGIRHGFVFEVSSTVRRPTQPIPLVAMGRFNHEAVAVDPTTGYVYETEDQGDSCFYRFIPNQPGTLQAGGALYALVIAGEPTVNTATGFLSRKGEKLPVEWVKIDEVNPDSDTLRFEAQRKGAAIFRRGEGAWYGNGLIYFVCTSGGENGTGQVWAYDPLSNTLTLTVESEANSELEQPDNITVAPFGDLFLCEDGDGKDRVIGVTQGGQLYEFARNALPNDTSEFAGACFSPNGQWLFVNSQIRGITFGIQGPWLSPRPE